MVFSMLKLEIYLTYLIKLKKHGVDLWLDKERKSYWWAVDENLVIGEITLQT